MKPDSEQRRSRPFLTILMWAAAATALAVAGLVTTEFVLMATSLDPSDMIAAGVEPWRDAAVATGAFLGLLVTAIASLWLWHTARFRPVGVVLLAAAVGAVTWVCGRVFAEYF